MAYPIIRIVADRPLHHKKHSFMPVTPPDDTGSESASLPHSTWKKWLHPARRWLDKDAQNYLLNLFKGYPFSSTRPVIPRWTKFGKVAAKITQATGLNFRTGLLPKIPVQDTLSTCDGQRDFAARLAARLTSPDVRLGGD